jgi:hypothetical protein
VNLLRGRIGLDWLNVSVSESTSAYFVCLTAVKGWILVAIKSPEGLRQDRHLVPLIHKCLTQSGSVTPNRSSFGVEDVKVRCHSHQYGSER